MRTNVPGGFAEFVKVPEEYAWGFRAGLVVRLGVCEEPIRITPRSDGGGRGCEGARAVRMSPVPGESGSMATTIRYNERD